MVFGKVKLVTQVNRRRTQSVAAKVLTPCNPVTSDGLEGGEVYPPVCPCHQVSGLCDFVQNKYFKALNLL